MKKKSSRPAMVPREVIDRCMAPRSRGGRVRYTGNMALLPPPPVFAAVEKSRAELRAEIQRAAGIPFDAVNRRGIPVMIHSLNRFPETDSRGGGAA